MMEAKDDAIYSRNDVLAGFGWCGETLRRNVARKKFPPPAKIGRETFWPGSVIRKHIETLQAKAASGKR